LLSNTLGQLKVHAAHRQRYGVVFAIAEIKPQQGDHHLTPEERSLAVVCNVREQVMPQENMGTHQKNQERKTIFIIYGKE